MRITGLEAASRPSMNTLNTTLGYRARLEPLLMRTRFSSAPARATNRVHSGRTSYIRAQGAWTPRPWAKVVRSRHNSWPRFDRSFWGWRRPPSNGRRPRRNCLIPDAADRGEIAEGHVGCRRRRSPAGEETLRLAADRASVPEGGGAHAGGVGDGERFGVAGGGGGGCGAVEGVTDLGSGLERGAERDRDGKLEEVGSHGRAPGGDADRVENGVGVPETELREFVREVKGGCEVLLEMLDDLFGVEVGGESPGGVVAGMRVGHVAGQDAAQAGGLHGLQAHRLSEEADLGVEPDVEEVGESALPAEGIDLGLGIGHEICLADAQAGARRPSRNSRRNVPGHRHSRPRRGRADR